MGWGGREKVGKGKGRIDEARENKARFTATFVACSGQGQWHWRPVGHYGRSGDTKS